MSIDGSKSIGKPTYTERFIKKPARKVKNAAKTAIDAVDKYTSPRPDTEGSFEKASYFQACFTGMTEGMYIMGAPGLVVGAVPAGIGVAVNNKTGKPFLGVLAGIASGAALGAAAGALTANPAGVVGMAVTGGILGAMETYRGDANGRTRDSAGNANMVSALFVPGPAKMAGGIGAATGSKVKGKFKQAAVGATVAGVLGGTLAAVGFAPVSIPIAVAGCAMAGAVGPSMGPRFSQLFRNLASDIGKGVKKLGKKLGFFKKDDAKEKRTQNAIGSIPAAFLKESLRGFALSDGNIPKMLLGGVTESLEQIHIFIKQKMGDEEAEFLQGDKKGVDAKQMDNVKKADAKPQAEKTKA